MLSRRKNKNRSRRLFLNELPPEKGEYAYKFIANYTALRAVCWL